MIKPSGKALKHKITQNRQIKSYFDDTSFGLQRIVLGSSFSGLIYVSITFPLLKLQPKMSKHHCRGLGMRICTGYLMKTSVFSGGSSPTYFCVLKLRKNISLGFFLRKMKNESCIVGFQQQLSFSETPLNHGLYCDELPFSIYTFCLFLVWLWLAEILGKFATYFSLAGVSEKLK